jgi:hypothetical protein
VQAITTDVDHLPDGRVLLLEARFGASGYGEENAYRNGEQDKGQEKRREVHVISP